MNTFFQALNELPNDITKFARYAWHGLKSRQFWGVIGRGLFIFGPYATLSYILKASLDNGSFIVPTAWLVCAMAVILKEQDIKARTRE